jgi:hypothetical protein
MIQRGLENSNLHDRVILEIKNVLNQQDFDIYTNPGQEKNAGIMDNYPDVVMTKKGNTTVKFILEIETSDSITLAEADGQWKKYASEIKATFYIVAPEYALQKAKELCQQVGVNARFATYSLDNNGNITFNFK